MLAATGRKRFLHHVLTTLLHGNARRRRELTSALRLTLRRTLSAAAAQRRYHD